MAALDAYTGPWDERHAGHLLRRASFVTRPDMIKQVVGMGLSAAVDLLLQDKAAPPGPVDPGLSTQGTWTYNMTTPHPDDNQFRGLVKAWWFQLMLQPTNISALEKLTLFWHNHFATEADTVSDSRFQYYYNATIRRNALGNFKTFVRDITLDCAMLRYLNGDTNTAAHPNENYARELQELFTIGKGLERSPGDYTNYTEDDIKAAAKVLTGWRTVRIGDPSKSVFQANAHDGSNKSFSAAYQNKVISGAKDEVGARRELDDLLNMILAQDETARYIVRKLFRWYVFYEIDDATEQNVIRPLAAQFKQNGYDIKPILATLFKSQVFFDDQNIGAMIKSPIDWFVGLSNLFSFSYPTDTTKYLSAMTYALGGVINLQQNLMDPPSVAGWQAYYQSPDYYKQWINSATLPQRYGYTDAFVYGGGRTPTGFIIDTLAVIASVVGDPTDAEAVVKDLGAYIMPAYNLTSDEVTYLATQVLMAGAQVYEWATIWSEYKNNPGNSAKRKTAEDRSKALFRYMFRMAEFQLM